MGDCRTIASLLHTQDTVAESVALESLIGIAEIYSPTDSTDEEYKRYSPDEPHHPTLDIKEGVLLDLSRRLYFSDFLR